MLGFILWFGLTLGLQEGKTKLSYYEYELPPISIKMDIHAESTWLDLYGSIESNMEKCDWMRMGFTPLLDSYTVGASATFGQLSITAEHQCTHPVNPYNINDALQYDLWYNRIEVTIRSKP
jgi:hypothetical protein